MINPESSATISKIHPHHNKKSIQYFMGKINFVRRFVRSFTQTIKPLQYMVKQKAEYKWEIKRKEAFTNIKRAIMDAPSLMSPDFSKGFVMYSFVAMTRMKPF